jgi:TolB-like protein
LIYLFENFSLNEDRQELRRGDELVAVEPQVFDLLQYLIENRERVVSKDDLIENVWDGRIVSDSTLTSRITSARQAVGDNGEDQRLIRTVARKGIRFVGEVSESQGNAAGSASSPTDAPLTISHGSMVPRLPEKPSIAVLPFTNMSGDSEQEYFSDGITEDIINALSRLRWFFVIARNSTFVYKGQAADVRQVGRDLGVRYVLEGSVRKSGQRIRITSQLLDANTSNQIWSERYDRELTDIFALQDEITASVTSAIEPKLLAAEGTRTESRSTEDLDAWDMVARAVSHFWKLTAADSATAIGMLREAVKRHPNYAPAQSMLAFALFASAYVGWIPAGTDRDFAAGLARRAAEIDDSDPWAHMALGYFEFTGRNTDEAVRHFKAALDLNPNFAAAEGSIGFALALDGQSEEAINRFDQAIRMSPRDPFNSFFFVGVAAAHYLAGRYTEAVKWARQAVQLRPGYMGAHRILCASLAQADQLDEAKAVMATLKQLQPNLSIAAIRQSVPYTARAIDHFVEGMQKAGLTE